MSFYVLDFETEAIHPRPNYPPRPVGLAVRYPSGKTSYITDLIKIGVFLRKLWSGNEELIFHNAPFDMEVAQKSFGLPNIPWHRVHDTMLLAFLHSPYASSYALKDFSEDVLGIAPLEKDFLREWILDNIPEATRRPSSWGAYISRAPIKLVSKYAKGDVERTYAIFKALYSKVSKEAYDRERQLQPILLRAEQRGIKIDREALDGDLIYLDDLFKKVSSRLVKILGYSDINILNSNYKLANALGKKKFITKWEMTEKGNRKVAKDSLIRNCNNKEFIRLFSYRSTLKTLLNTFVRGWIDKCAGGDRIHPKWNQVRNGVAGSRTGRITSVPNVLNVPKNYESIEGFPELPNPRRYIIPDQGYSLLKRDYAQQEIRILAHFLGGPIASAFYKNQNLDLHFYAQEMMKKEYDINLNRLQIKTLFFGIIYGMGLDLLSSNINVSKEDARNIRDSYISILPGLRKLQNKIKEDNKILTWGGRTYHPETPKTNIRNFYVFGKGWVKREHVEKDYAYKLLNYLIQGSASDCTKQAIINLDSYNSENSNFLLQVYDEFLIQALKGKEKREMKILKEAMMDVDFSPVEMLSEGKIGYENWSELEDF